MFGYDGGSKLLGEFAFLENVLYCGFHCGANYSLQLVFGHVGLLTALELRARVRFGDHGGVGYVHLGRDRG